jgi:signal peptidase I
MTVKSRLSAARTPTVRLVLGLAVAIAAWASLGPQQLGGRAAYVMVNGTSMLPKFHGGDLVVVQKTSSYHVGEVVAYRNDQLHVTVMHRIVALDGDRYVFKGDNNSWQDNEHPTRQALLGVEKLHIPHAGRYLQELRQPFAALLIMALATVFAFAGNRGQGKLGRRRSRHHARA